jgi:hypothetical protein
VRAKGIHNTKVRASALHNAVDHLGQRHHQATDDLDGKCESQLTSYKVSDDKVRRSAILVGFEAPKVLDEDGRFKLHGSVIAPQRVNRHPIPDKAASVGGLFHFIEYHRIA